MSKNWCFYHSSDLDGKCSAALVDIYLNGNVTLMPINYDKPFPFKDIKKDDTVYMVDFGLQPFGEMVKLNKMCNLIWIDHHSSAIKDYEKSGTYIDGLRRVGDAGCELIWEYFWGTSHIPKVVHLLGRYDIWDWQNTPNALEFQYGMKLQENTHPSNKDLWETLIVEEDDYIINDIISKGKMLAEYEQTQNKSLCRYLAFETEIDGFQAIAINEGGDSIVLDSVWDPIRHDLRIMFVRKYGKWSVSLYTSKDGVDVSEIAKEHGGGGHKGASGFSCFTLPFDY